MASALHEMIMTLLWPLTEDDRWQSHCGGMSEGQCRYFSEKFTKKVRSKYKKNLFSILYTVTHSSLPCQLCISQPPTSLSHGDPRIFLASLCITLTFAQSSLPCSMLLKFYNFTWKHLIPPLIFPFLLLLLHLWKAYKVCCIEEVILMAPWNKTKS